MKVEVKKLDKLKRKIRVEVEKDEFQDKKKEAYGQISKNLKVPGFRPGNAPLEVLERQHGKLLKEEFLKSALPHFYQKALEENKMLPASMPEIYDVQVSFENLSFWAEFEVQPEIEAKEDYYKGLKIKAKKVEIKDEETEKILANLKNGIKKVTDKELNEEETARWASYPDSASLKEAVRGQLFIEKANQRRQNIEGQVRTQLLKAFKFDLPASEVQRHQKEMLDREIYSRKLQGASQENIDKYKKELEEKIAPIASDEVKLFYIFEAIARKENIKIENGLADVVLGFILSQAQYE